MCRMSEGTKSMTKNKTEVTAWESGKNTVHTPKYDGCGFLQYLKILDIS